MPPNRLLIARTAFVTGALSALWLGGGMLDLVPLLDLVDTYNNYRLHAGFTIGCLLVAAWGYWNT